jgi:hypothetical protein
MVRSAPRPVISDETLWTTGISGYDASMPLPPFLPVFRGEDHVFSMLLARASPRFLRAFLPWVAAHRPLEPRRGDPRQIVPPTIGLDVSDLLVTLVEGMPPFARDRSPWDLLRAIGRGIAEIGALPPPALADALHEARSRRFAAILEHHEKNLSSHRRRPSFWADDVARYVRRIEGSLAEPSGLLPLELRELRWNEALRRAGRLLGMTGSLLQEWPDIVETARGVRLGE